MVPYYQHLPLYGIFRPPVQGGSNELISKFLSSMILYNHPSYFKSGEINSCRLSPLPTIRSMSNTHIVCAFALWFDLITDTSRNLGCEGKLVYGTINNVGKLILYIVLDVEGGSLEILRNFVLFLSSNTHMVFASALWFNWLTRISRILTGRGVKDKCCWSKVAFWKQKWNLVCRVILSIYTFYIIFK